MKIAVIGSGFTGLTASYFLAKAGFEVTLFEKEASVGGLASGFRVPGWDWALERHYHHIFTSDKDFLGLASEIGFSQNIFFKRPVTSVFRESFGIFPFDSPASIVTSPILNLLEKIRLGAVTFFLRIIPDGTFLERWAAYDFLIKTMGRGAFSKIFEPLIDGKFGPHAKKVNMAWFWARVKKRSPSLGYVKGGFQTFADALREKVCDLNGSVILGCTVTHIRTEGDKWNITYRLDGMEKTETFGKILFTTPSQVFTDFFPDLDPAYRRKVLSVPHLSALNLVILTSSGLLDKTYWLNINEKSFPFISVVEHTNFIDRERYGGKRIIYIGNYLPNDHPFLSLTKEELVKTYEPYLKKVNEGFSSAWITDSFLFAAPFAQPVVGTNYSKMIPTFSTPIKNVFLANMDMVYPWDRGTNYAIELGRRAAKTVSGSID